MPPQDQQNSVPTAPSPMPPAPPPMPAPVQQGMSPAVSAVLALIILAAIAGATYWYMMGGALPNMPGAEQTATGETPSATLPTGGSTADASLDQDLGAIDAQLGAFASDNASVNDGLNDSPVGQAQL